MTTISITGAAGAAGANGGNPNGNGVPGGNGTTGQSETASLTKPDSSGNTMNVSGGYGGACGKGGNI